MAAARGRSRRFVPAPSIDEAPGWVVLPEVGPGDGRSAGFLEAAGVVVVRQRLVTPAELLAAVPGPDELARRLVDAVREAVAGSPVTARPGLPGLFGIDAAAEAALRAARQLRDSLGAIVAIGARPGELRSFLHRVGVPTLVVARPGALPGRARRVEIREHPEPGSDAALAEAAEWMRAHLVELGRTTSSRERRPRRTVRRILPAAVLAVASIVATAPPSLAQVTTTFQNGVLTITGDGADDAITLSRTTGGQLRLNGTAIKGGPTTTNTDTVNIFTGEGTNTVTLDFTGGLFAPGFTHETSGKSEIEVNLAGGSGPDTLQLIGTPLADRIDVGANGFNVNGDNDVDKTGGGFDVFVIKGGAGNDRLSAAGSKVAGAPFAFEITLDGGAGNDTITAGGAVAKIIGGGGPDLLSGAKFSDSLFGGAAADKLFGYAGKDKLDGGSGTDNGNGGPGTDTCISVEIKTSCP